MTARTAARLAAARYNSAPLANEADAQREFVREVLRRTRDAVQQEIGLPAADGGTGQLAADPGTGLPAAAPPTGLPAADAGTNRPAADTLLLPAASTVAELAAPAGGAAAFHSTLLLAILTETSLLVGNVGDGWLVTCNRDGALGVSAPPNRGEYVNETFFLTSEGAIDEASLAVVPVSELEAIALMSDGPAWFAIDLEQGVPSQPLFEKLFAFASDPELSGEEKDRQLATFLASPEICRRTDDDKTLILAVRAAAAAAPPADDAR